LLANRCVLQQQHVDCNIADALLKKGTKQHADGWDAHGKAWAPRHTWYSTCRTLKVILG
jgi:hypothetical protein